MLNHFKNILSFLIIFSVLGVVKVQGQTTTVQMQRDEGGTYTVPCKVNGLTMRFIFDTGASTVCISATEALFMLKNGYLDRSDIKGKNYSQVASGDIVEGMTINLRKVEIGSLPLYNVEANVVNSLSAPLLFGQTAIQKLGPIKLDGDKLIIGKVSVLNEEQRKKKALELNNKAFYAGESGNYEEAIKLYNEANENYPMANSYDGLVNVYDHMGKYDLALRASEQAVALEPDNISYKYNYSVELFQNKKYDTAIRFFKEVWELGTSKPISKEEIMFVGNACNYLGDIYMMKEMTSTAKGWFLKANNVLKTDAHSMLNLGDIAFDSLQYRKAIEYMKAGVSIEPNRLSNLPRYYKMGKAYEYLNVNDSSSICYGKAMDIYKRFKSLTSKESSDPVGLRLYSYAMESYLEQARWQFRFAMERNFDMMGKLACSFADSCYTFVIEEGYGLFNGRKGAFSENDFAKLLTISVNVGDTTSFKRSMFFLYKLYPNNINYAYVMASLSNDDNAKYISICEKAKNSSNFYIETRPELLNNLAWALCKAEDYNHAEQNASEAIRLDGSDPNKWETYGECLYYQGKYKQCIEAMSKSIDLTTNQSNPEKWLKSAYKLRGESYIKIGKKSKGEEDLTKSSHL